MFTSEHQEEFCAYYTRQKSQAYRADLQTTGLSQNEVCGREAEKIVYGSIHEWNDVEADEVDVAKGDDDHLVMNPKKTIVWEQWGGIVERGAPESLMLTRLDPSKTIRRAPGPGPI